jgi:hypothetical protein
MTSIAIREPFSRGLTMLGAANDQLRGAGPAAMYPEMTSADYVDPVVEAYKKDVDRSLLRQNLKLTVEERLRKAIRLHVSVDGWRKAGIRALTDSTAKDLP